MPRCGYVQRSAAVLVIGASLLLGCGGTEPPDVAAVQVVSGDEQFGVAGAALAQPLVVSAQDSKGDGIPGVEVQFMVTQGGGQVSSANPKTDGSGKASVTFTLGSTAGSAQQVTATANNHTVTINATATNPPAAMNVFSGNGESAASGVAVPTAPQVKVVDAGGQPVGGVAVTFQVTRGGGNVTGASKVTDANGLAAPDQWRLGPSGVNTLEATADVETLEGEPATFTATTTPEAGKFDIVVHYEGNPPQTLVLAIAEAEVRWESLITSDLEDAPANVPAETCGPGTPAINENIDDLVIFAEVPDTTIDGPGGTLAQSYPCLIRDLNGDDNFEVGELPGVGFMFFDSDDLQFMEQTGVLGYAAVHEMGHVLGFGSLWRSEGLLADPSSRRDTSGVCLSVDSSKDPHFTGTAAIAAFNAAGGSSNNIAKVPVENMFGCGSADGHWRESLFDNELMTSLVEPAGVLEPLSAISLASLVDQGYTVNASAADAYTLPQAGSHMLASRGGVYLGNDIVPFPVRMLKRNGRPGRIVRP
jgi:hypothetical protein